MRCSTWDSVRILRQFWKDSTGRASDSAFSATMPKAILEITKQFQKDAELVKVTKKELTVPNIEQFYYEVKPKNKEEVLSRLLDIYTPKALRCIL